MSQALALSPVFPRTAALDERGRLQLGGVGYEQLVEEHGTPLYVVDAEELRARARTYVRTLAERHAGPGLVLYAVKALPVLAVARLFAEEGLGALASTGGELELALRAGFDPARIALHGNGKSAAELARAVEAGIGWVIADNVADLDKLEAAVQAAGAPPQRVLVRVTPGVQADTHPSIATGQGESKFGFAMEQAPDAIARVAASAQLELAGLHCHVGSQLQRPYREVLHALAELGDFGTYDLGGGLGVAYAAGDEPPAIELFVGEQVRAAHDLLADGPGKQLLVEPGRSLVATAGVTLYRVESVKRNVRTWVAVDGGMSDNPRPSLYGARYEAEVADRFTSAAEPGQRVHLAGKHCESGDVLVRDVALRDPQVGDVVVVPATGAYGYGMASTYNLTPRSAVVLVDRGEARLAVRRETVEDLLARDVG